MYYPEVGEKYGKIEGFVAYDNVPYSSGLPGAMTDDTTLRHYMGLGDCAQRRAHDARRCGEDMVWRDSNRSASGAPTRSCI